MGRHYARLDRALNLAAHKLARAHRMKKDAYLADLLMQWGSDYIPPKEDAMSDNLIGVELRIPDGNWKNIAAKAKAEGRDVSRVLHELVMKEIP